MESPGFYDPTWGQKPSDVLACGNRRSDHDHNGWCDECPVCKIGICPSDADVQEHDGEHFHSGCLLADRKRKTIIALDAFLVAMRELSNIDEECLIIPGDPIPNGAEAYDAWDLLNAWRNRNSPLLDGAAK